MASGSPETSLEKDTPRRNNNHNQSTSGYIVIPQTFSGDFTEFEWWKRKMYTHIIGLDDDL